MIGMVSDLVDSSGLRFTYTPNIREFDGGVMQVGHLVTPYQHIIPPHADSFLSYGDCSSQCLSAVSFNKIRCYMVKSLIYIDFSMCFLIQGNERKRNKCDSYFRCIVTQPFAWSKNNSQAHQVLAQSLSKCVFSRSRLDFMVLILGSCFTEMEMNQLLQQKILLTTLTIKKHDY